MALNKKKGKTNKKGPLDLVGSIIKYENNEMNEEETREFFVELHNLGALRHLQGSYGRTFQGYLSSGQIEINERGKAVAQDVED